MSTEKKAAKKKKDGAAPAPKRGVGVVATEAILAGKTNEETLAIVQKAFPDGKTSLASINWYRNKLRGENKKVLTARELKKKNSKKKDPLE
jgi:CHASE3 domain sensor protein